MSDDLRTMIFEVRGPSAPDEAGGNAPAAAGWIGLVASARGLRLLALPAPTHEEALVRVRGHYADVRMVAEDAFLSGVARQVEEFLTGRRRQFNVDLDLRGNTSFGLAVWAAAARIPYGETRTYAWIAAQVGSVPGAAQAVGTALGANPVPLIIPCHRVIGSDGSLHGFAGGLDMKGRLLAMETGQAHMTLDI